MDEEGLLSIQVLGDYADFPISDLRLRKNFYGRFREGKINPVIAGNRIRWGAVDLVFSLPTAFSQELYRRKKLNTVFPACLIIAEADSIFSHSIYENTMLDIIQRLRPRYTEEDPLFANLPALIDPLDRAAWKRQRNKERKLLETPNRTALLKGSTASNGGALIKEGSITNVLGTPRSEISPVQFVFVGAALPEGRANCVGQRVLQRWPLTTAIPPVDTAVSSSNNTFLEAKTDDRSLFSLASDLVSVMEKNVTLARAVTYVNSRKTCTALYHFLSDRRWNVFMLHGNLSLESRLLAYRNFVRSETPAILLTTDFGSQGVILGDDIDHIINLQFPRSAQAYLHRCGRQRPGGESPVACKVTSFVSPRDAVTATAIQDLEKRGLPYDVAFTRKRSLATRAKNEVEAFCKGELLKPRHSGVFFRCVENASCPRLTSTAEARMARMLVRYRKAPRSLVTPSAITGQRALIEKFQAYLVRRHSKRSNSNESSTRNSHETVGGRFAAVLPDTARDQKGKSNFKPDAPCNDLENITASAETTQLRKYTITKTPSITAVHQKLNMKQSDLTIAKSAPTVEASPELIPRDMALELSKHNAYRASLNYVPRPPPKSRTLDLRREAIKNFQQGEKSFAGSVGLG